MSDPAEVKWGTRPGINVKSTGNRPSFGPKLDQTRQFGYLPRGAPRLERSCHHPEIACTASPRDRLQTCYLPPFPALGGSLETT
ncbi:hypothetical protein J6590_012750 [Homalodisca vitripennis]|nr:hypothetical protein J6590_012750 [Homalodisca vitripennis]